MRRFGLLFVAVGAALLLAALPNQVLAEGKASDIGPQNDQPVDTPGSGAAGGGGRGVPSQTEAPSTPPPARHQEPTPDRWNSAAAAIWRHRGRVHVAIGYSGVRQTSDDARASALDACRSAGGQGCKPIGAWNNGCLYITTGTSSNRAGWGSGGSIEAALKKCRSYGFTCKKPIGGCID
ncbi:MAG TPA: DUF4189 domain-containing protein [Xanthobacteraceae bacterium]|nr:DUF4189 domain-containing protein [Xanthobacteraceae bacterium]